MKPIHIIAFLIAVLSFNGTCAYMAYLTFTSAHRWAFESGCGIIMLFIIFNVEFIREGANRVNK